MTARTTWIFRPRVRLCSGVEELRYRRRLGKLTMRWFGTTRLLAVGPVVVETVMYFRFRLGKMASEFLPHPCKVGGAEYRTLPAMPTQALDITFLSTDRMPFLVERARLRRCGPRL